MSEDNQTNNSSETSSTSEKRDAEMGLSSVTLNAYTSRLFAGGSMGDIDFIDAVKVVIGKTRKVTENNTKELEITLAAQVGSLDVIFTEMARRSAMGICENNLHVTEAYMRIALKAQAQCARTIEVLANLKNPPVVYAKQANISNGPQQVNNGIHDNPHAHVEKVENQQNKLLSEKTNETMDIGGAATPGKLNQEMEAVGTKHRRKDRKG